MQHQNSMLRRAAAVERPGHHEDHQVRVQHTQDRTRGNGASGEPRPGRRCRSAMPVPVPADSRAISGASSRRSRHASASRHQHPRTPAAPARRSPHRTRTGGKQQGAGDRKNNAPGRAPVVGAIAAIFAISAIMDASSGRAAEAVLPQTRASSGGRGRAGERRNR